jgi:hypothetical protein
MKATDDQKGRGNLDLVQPCRRQSVAPAYSHDLDAVGS